MIKISLVACLLLIGCSPRIEFSTIEYQCKDLVKEAQNKVIKEIQQRDNIAIVYNSRVRITKGFYRGMTGTTIDVIGMRQNLFRITLDNKIIGNDGKPIFQIDRYADDLEVIK